MDRIPHRVEGECVLGLSSYQCKAYTRLRLGVGLLHGLLTIEPSEFEGLALDYSDTMLDVTRRRFEGDGRINVMRRDMNM